MRRAVAGLQHGLVLLVELDHQVVQPRFIAGDLQLGDGSLTGEVGQEGDTDGNGIVNLDDLNAVRNNFGNTGTPGSTPGDAFPFDGIVNLDDLNGVRNNFGAGPSTPSPNRPALR